MNYTAERITAVSAFNLEDELFQSACRYRGHGGLVLKLHSRFFFCFCFYRARKGYSQCRDIIVVCISFEIFFALSARTGSDEKSLKLGHKQNTFLVQVLEMLDYQIRTYKNVFIAVHAFLS